MDSETARDLRTLERLDKFVKRTDKQAPMFFEGRHGIVRKILETAEEVRVKHCSEDAAPRRTDLSVDDEGADNLGAEDKDSEVEGGIFAIHGPPGSGKTSTAKELEKHPEKVAVVHVNADDLADEKLVMTKILTQVIEREMDKADSIADKTSFAVRSLFVTATGSPAMVTEMIDIAQQAPEFQAFDAARRGIRFLAAHGKTLFSGISRETRRKEVSLERMSDLKKLPAECWNRPLILVIDEFQQMREKVRPEPLKRSWNEVDGRETVKKGTWSKKQRDRAVTMLRDIQKGNHGLPMLAVCAGLSDMVNTLEDLGLSRPASSRRFALTCLERGAAMRVVERFMKECGIRRETELEEIWKKTIVGQTHGYPQHLHNGLVQLGNMLKECKRDLAQVSVEEWKNQEGFARSEAYAGRTTASMIDAAPVIAAIMHAMGDHGMSIDSFAELANIEKGRPELKLVDSARWVRDLNDKWLLDHLLHQGALQIPKPTRCENGIPSFRKWLSHLDLPLHREASMRNRKGVEDALADAMKQHHVHLKDRSGKTALQLAEETGCKETSDLIRQHMHGLPRNRMFRLFRKFSWKRQ